jgi:hypothetical protein
MLNLFYNVEGKMLVLYQWQTEKAVPAENPVQREKPGQSVSE